MQRVSDRFIIIHEDYMIATEDVGCSAIISLIENLSRKNADKEGYWVTLSAQSIEEMTMGIVAKRTVSRKIKALAEKGLVEVRMNKDSWPEYRLNQQALLSAVEAALTPTQNAYPPYAKCVPPPTQIAYPPYANCVPIISTVISTNEETKRRSDETPRSNRETTSRTTDTLEEKEKPEQKEEPDLNEEVRTLLKSYDKIPKSKRDRFCRGSINALYKAYGDALERLTNEYGLDSCLEALENFKRDEYWEKNGFPIRGFIKQIERFLENASANTGGYQGVAKKEKIEPRVESAQIPATLPATLDLTPEDKEREKIRIKSRRIHDVLSLVKQTMPDKLQEFDSLTRNTEAADPAVVEQWFNTARSLWMESHGGFEPPCRTKPLC